MNVAFYAPMKSPDHPVPSGDRTIARALQAALRHAGHDVCNTSRMRIYDKLGDPQTQERLQAEAKAEADRLIAAPEARAWDVWLTYHNYYKAPDLIGPRVCEALDLPYALVEATRARKRLSGPWARFAQGAEAASDAAQTIFYFTQRDAEALRRDAPKNQRLVELPPFLSRADLPEATTRSSCLLAVGMMRAGDKLASYALIADALKRVQRHDWSLEIIGDGPARAEVERLFVPFGERVRLLGEYSPEQMAKAYSTAKALIWPGVNEAFGFVYLEAQAAGLAVIAQDRPGVRDVVNGVRVPLDAGAAGLAERIQSLLGDPVVCADEGQRNRAHIQERHLLPAAARTLDQTLRAMR
jgi:glycosyltransferase involved in cell wall biosynthesis